MQAASGSEALGLDGFTAIYDRLLPHVYGYFLRRLAGDRALAEDLTQDTFLSAVRALPAELENEHAWLITIARRRFVDHLRHTSRRPATVRLADSQRAEHERANGGWPDEWGAEEHVVLSSLRTLAPDHQLVLVLHHVDGLSITEVASHLERSESAIESLLARARRALRRAVEEVSP